MTEDDKDGEYELLARDFDEAKRLANSFLSSTGYRLCFLELGASTATYAATG
jgi:hypothetical protein